DNEGLSRERAGEAAEFLKNALGLPPEAVAFSWAGESEPVASNATEAGRAQNRRVEVEVWYDEVEQQVSVEQYLVTEDFERVKVCRVETVCKMRFLEGHERRARVQNLVAPLPIGEENARVPDDFVRQVGQVLRSLGDKQNVTVKLIGYTDDAPLSARSARIYGTHLALSKAMARRVSLALQDALELPSRGVASDGRGTARPVASNETAQGRALNRRVEVEIWYDDPLQELPDEPQVCPDSIDDAVVTRVYEPAWGALPQFAIEEGDPVLPADYEATLRRALADVADKTNARLRFVGYTGNQTLERRTAQVYGDDIGLSTARARRTQQLVQEQLGLAQAQVEHEGRGYVHARDVVNGGFIQGESSYVEVQVVYDEPALLDDYEGVQITRLTREIRPSDPLALNLMRITVDGVPIDDPGRSSADIQRCTDVALEQARIELRFDDLDSTPRLAVSSDVRQVAVAAADADDAVVPAEDEPAVVETDEAAAAAGGDATPITAATAAGVRFDMYTNYPHFISRAEVRIFDREQSQRAAPLAVVEVGPDGAAHWQPEDLAVSGPARPLEFVLRAYDEKGRFDETAPQTLWLVNGSADRAALAAAGSDAGAATETDAPAPGSSPTEPFAAYGESELVKRNIDLGGAGAVRVQGEGVPEGHSVWLAGRPVPVDENGRFVAEAVLPAGLHTVEVAVLDEQGNGELYLRDLELEKSDWFYVGTADVTLAGNVENGNPDALQGMNSQTDPGSFADGRLAFYVNGRWGEDWRLTASADTREGPIDEIFSNFLDKSPDALFRRLDPDYFQPTFGDDGTVEETAPTMGKFYAKLARGDDHAMWGNFAVGYRDNELALVERGLYGGNLRYQTDATTRFGERRVTIDGFAADPGTVPSREEFRGTGGSLYYLRHRDLVMGSDRLRIEVRDKDSGLVTAIVPLSPDLDYDLDYIQGRVLLNEPISAIADDRLLVRTGGLSGHETWLVVQYEYTPGFDELDALAVGGQGSLWLNDWFEIGATAYRNDQDSDESGLYGASFTARKSTESWLKAQAGWSEGLLTSSFRSNDGGFGFTDATTAVAANDGALGYRADASLGFGDLWPGAPGRLSAYFQRLEAGYSAPGQIAATDTDQYGGTLTVPVTDAISLNAKADRLDQEQGLETNTQELDVSYQLTDRVGVRAGVRNDEREDHSPVVPLTQDEGARTDAVVQAGYDSRGRWTSYVFGQATVRADGTREENNRGGVGGSYRVDDRLIVDGEVSYGDGGPAVRVGSEYQASVETRRYLNYALDNERLLDGRHARRGNLVSGARTRLSDSASMYTEDRYQHDTLSNGLSRAMGMDWSPNERWSFGADWETGSLVDRLTAAETQRNAGGGRVSYRNEPLLVSSGVEYRDDETVQPTGLWSDRTTWLFRNSLRLQLSEDWRLLGKLDHSFSDSSLGDFFDGGYTEGVFGFGYRPVAHDRLNVLAKYTYFYNLPATDQVGSQGTATQFLQKSHIASLDVTYDLTEKWTLGGKYAYRRGEVSLDRVNPQFFDN
ncbi:MAG TPA: flagellar motor protein MotB, partial [Planctomycetota bacterium]|nr:flagellar motor protein MotB [Planctomycetota bacterium]